MRPVEVFVVGIENDSGVAGELFAALRGNPLCNLVLRNVSSGEIADSEFPADSIAVFTHSDPKELARAIKPLKQRSPRGIFVFVNLFQEPTNCLDLLMAGYDSFLTYPFGAENVPARLHSMLARKNAATQSEAGDIARKLALEIGLKDMIGSSDSFSRVLEEIKVLSRVDATVLITGETGTGKDMCARAIHYAGPRSSKPFIPVNCGAIPDELFANELFGHERGAFTDARSRHHGMIQNAEGGTLFLDDVEALSLTNQARLLRFLQSNEFAPLGFGRPLRADVRVIAATNADLAEKIKQRAFREDIYFRLAVLTLSLPALRNRTEDIPALANHLVARYCSSYGKPVISLSASAVRKLSSYRWPGNVRELENVLHRAVVHSASPVLVDSDLILDSVNGGSNLSGGDLLLPFDQARSEVLSHFEREYIVTLLRLCGGNVTRAARRAGKHRRSFWEIMRRHNISRSSV